MAASAEPVLYEATLTDKYGSPSINEQVTVRLSLVDSEGRQLYAETHAAGTDSFGHLYAMVGEGFASEGEYSEQCLTASAKMEVTITRADGSEITSTAGLGYVPAALYADSAEALVSRSSSEGRYSLSVDDDGALSTTFVRNEAIPIPDGYTRLLFHDEFDYEGLPDPRYWSYEKGYVRNGELQYYTENRLENTSVRDGKLFLTIREETDYTAPDGTAPQYTSGSIHTQDKVKFTYGRVEIRAKFSSLKGTWPGLWLMPNDSEYGPWPRSGEIDIVEQVGYDPDVVHFTAHCYLQNGDNNKYHHYMRVPTCHTDFHVYAFEWKEDRMTWYVDGKRGFTVVKNTPLWTGWPYDRDFYIILDMAWGGGWGGQQGIDSSGLPESCEIDYIRVFQ